MTTLGDMVKHVRNEIGPEAGQELQFLVYMGCTMCGRRLLDHGPHMRPECLVVSDEKQVFGVFCHVCRPEIMERMSP